MTGTAKFVTALSTSFVIIVSIIALLGIPGYAPILSATSANSITQSFGIGSGPYSSNVNYFIHADGERLQNTTVTMALTDKLSGVSREATYGTVRGNWSFQVNAYAPTGYKAAYMQYVFGFDDGVGYFSVEYWSVSDTMLIATYGSSLISLPSSRFVSGMKIAITPLTNSTGNIIGANFRLDTDTATLYNQNLLLTSAAPNSKQYQSPMIGLEAHLIGYCCGESANFTKATGQFSYQSVTPLVFTSLPPKSFHFVQYHNTGTIEHSNISYDPPIGLSTTTITSTSTLLSISTATTTSTTTSTTTITAPAVTTTITAPASTTTVTSTRTLVTVAQANYYWYLVLGVIVLIGMGVGYLAIRMLAKGQGKKERLDGA